MRERKKKKKKNTIMSIWKIESIKRYSSNDTLCSRSQTNLLLKSEWWGQHTQNYDWFCRLNFGKLSSSFVYLALLQCVNSFTCHASLLASKFECFAVLFETRFSKATNWQIKNEQRRTNFYSSQRWTERARGRSNHFKRW